MRRTRLDENFEIALNKCRSSLFFINQLAIKEEQPDIKSQSCYIIEVLDTVLSNRKVRSSTPKVNDQC